VPERVDIGWPSGVVPRNEEKKKGQEFDEGVPRTPDRRSRLELIESASPIAFAEHPQYSNMQSPFQIGIVIHCSSWNPG